MFKGPGSTASMYITSYKRKCGRDFYSLFMMLVFESYTTKTSEAKSRMYTSVLYIHYDRQQGACRHAPCRDDVIRPLSSDAQVYVTSDVPRDCNSERVNFSRHRLVQWYHGISLEAHLDSFLSLKNPSKSDKVDSLGG